MPILSSFGGLSAIGRGQRAGNRVKKTITITGSIYNFNVWSNRSSSQHGGSVSVSAEPYSPGETDFEVTINSGVYVGSASTGSYAFTVDESFNVGDTVKIINNGHIYGKGGQGGYNSGGCGGDGITSGIAGYAGGPALYVGRPVTIVNNSDIGGGGGGGGNGGGLGRADYPNCSGGVLENGGAGGGGRGYPGGAAGGYNIYQATCPASCGYCAGSAGSTSSYGSGAAGTGGGGAGGRGGTLGEDGVAGNVGCSVSYSQWGQIRGPHYGGAKGISVQGSGYVTWETSGTVY